MIMTIDAGNTRIKGAVFEGDTLVDVFIVPDGDLKIKVSSILDDYKDITDIVVSSVGNAGVFAFSSFSNRVKVTFISRESVFPFTNDYHTPQTLGIDRMVLAAGAVFTYPGQNRLVVDAGTCITYDVVDENDHYFGGAISPGVNMRYNALNQNTANLPLLLPEIPDYYIGKSTEQSIHSGIVNGVAHEIDGFINQYREQYPKFTIILTGGDADFLAKQLKNTIFANSNFLLESLNHLYQYTNQK
jgi:type III pantothenate kinase